MKVRHGKTLEISADELLVEGNGALIDASGDSGTAGDQGLDEVRRLSGDVQASSDADAVQRPLLLEALSDPSQQSLAWKVAQAEYLEATSDPRAKADAHFSAYRAALETRDWRVALEQLGHALRLSTLLANAGYPSSRLMVSSNRSDFAAPNATVFHPDIVPDAAAAGLRYAISLEAAVADLRAAGEILQR